MRGFEQGTLGPRDITGASIGGPRKITLNAEVLTPFPGAGNDQLFGLTGFDSISHSMFWSMLLIAVGYSLVGAVRVQPQSIEIDPFARNHFSGVAAALLCMLALRFVFGRYALAVDGTGFQGAVGYTDVHARLLGHWVLAALALFAAAALVYGARKSLTAPGLLGIGMLIGDDGRVKQLYSGRERRPERPRYRLDGRGRTLIPGLIDAHVHLGVWEEGEGWAGQDTNEMTDPVMAAARAVDGINPREKGFDDALMGGITTVNVNPGSGNPIGGQAVVEHHPRRHR